MSKMEEYEDLMRSIHHMAQTKGSFITSRFNDYWVDSVAHLPVDAVARVAWYQGRKATLLQQELKKLYEEMDVQDKRQEVWLPKTGEKVLVRDNAQQEWQERTFLLWHNNHYYTSYDAYNLQDGRRSITVTPWLYCIPVPEKTSYLVNINGQAVTIPEDMSDTGIANLVRSYFNNDCE